MTRKIFTSVFLVSATVLFVSFLLASVLVYTSVERESQVQLEDQLALSAQAVRHQGVAYLKGLPETDTRFTLMAPNGKVSYDSLKPAATMDNHLGRPEIQQALKQGLGQSIRYSNTLMDKRLYVAEKLPDGRVLRLSLSQKTILGVFFQLLGPLAAVLMAAMGLSALMAAYISDKVVAPINSLDLDRPWKNSGFDELQPLFSKIENQQEELEIQRRRLSEKQQELNAVLDAMEEGMVLLNDKGQILSINAAAERLLGLSPPASNLPLNQLAKDNRVRQCITSALAGHPCHLLFNADERCYQLQANPVPSHEVSAAHAATLVLFDVTDRENAEHLRREFTTNVSHELKTPLHSISGYAELMKDGIAQAKDYPLFTRKIFDETQRTIAMVEQILNLSHLDEGAQEVPYEKVDILELAGQVVNRLEPEAQTRQVHLTLSGEPTKAEVKVPLISQVISNLCDNAIKYNQPEGSVSIRIWPEASVACIQVTDTGMGISESDQSRMFERFYRGDKSHSQEIGGSGLGLSIVKHAVSIHGGTIEVSSKLAEGTRILVRLPLESDAGNE